MTGIATTSQHRRKRNLYFESWWPEIIASFTSIASVVAIFSFLLAWEGRPIFSWHRITPNTIVAILATLARICNGISVSSALGQFKWIWHYTKARPLSDFALISGAATGPWDSLKLLMRTRSLSLMALGCWITLLALAFDAFIQQIVTFRITTEFHETTSNAIPFASVWNGGEAVGTGGAVQVTEEGASTPRSSEMMLLLGFPMQGAIISGLSANDSQISQQIAAICPTGNCKWENYQSLGVCSQCNDLTNVLQKREQPEARPIVNYLPQINFNAGENATLTEWYLPNGLRLNNANTYPTSDLFYAGTSVMATQTSSNPSHTLTFQDMSTLLLSISILKADQPPDNGTDYLNWADVSVSATECGLYLCIQEHNTTMVNGTLHDTSLRVVSSKRTPESFQAFDIPRVYSELPEQKELFNDTFWLRRSDLQLEPPEDSPESLNKVTNTNITQDSLDSLIVYLNSTFDGGALATRGGYNRLQLTGLTGMVISASDRTISSGKDAFVYAPPTLSTLWLTEDIAARFANLAKSMTNSMRTTSQVPSLDDDDSGNAATNTVSSLEGFEVTSLAVRWEWLILPAACVILGCLFLLLAIIHTRHHKVPLWKSHAIASLLHGFERVPSTDPYDDARLTEMERFAHGTLVSLVATERSGGRGNAWHLEHVPGGALPHTESEIPMVDRRGSRSGAPGFQDSDSISSRQPKFTNPSVASEVDEPLFQMSDADYVDASSHSTGVAPFESQPAAAAAMQVNTVRDDRVIPRKPLKRVW